MRRRPRLSAAVLAARSLREAEKLFEVAKTPDRDDGRDDEKAEGAGRENNHPDECACVHTDAPGASLTGGQDFCVSTEPRIIPVKARAKLSTPETLTSVMKASGAGRASRDFSRIRNPAGA